MLKLENEILIEYLAAKLNEEMKNILKNQLTNLPDRDIIDSSSEREVKTL